MIQLETLLTKLVVVLIVAALVGLAVYAELRHVSAEHRRGDQIERDLSR